MKTYSVCLMKADSYLAIDALLVCDNGRTWLEGEVDALTKMAGIQGMFLYFNNAVYGVPLLVVEGAVTYRLMWLFKSFHHVDQGKIVDLAWSMVQETIVAMSAADFLSVHLQDVFEERLESDEELYGFEDFLELRRDVFDDEVGEMLDVELKVMDNGRGYECLLPDGSVLCFDNAAYYDATVTCRLHDPQGLAEGSPLFRDVPVVLPPYYALGWPN